MDCGDGAIFAMFEFLLSLLTNVRVLCVMLPVFET